MRRLLVASLLAAGLASAFAQSAPSDNQQIRRRKTIGFGPSIPDAVYRLAPTTAPDNFVLNKDPFEVARAFIRDTIAGSVPPDSTFKIREDSYTDSRTGVTHIYARQYVGGVEVLNGDRSLIYLRADIRARFDPGRARVTVHTFYDSTKPHVVSRGSSPKPKCRSQRPAA